MGVKQEDFKEGDLVVYTFDGDRYGRLGYGPRPYGLVIKTGIKQKLSDGIHELIDVMWSTDVHPERLYTYEIRVVNNGDM